MEYDIEKEAENVMRTAAGEPNSAAKVHPTSETREQWEELKNLLRVYGSIVHYNDRNDTVKFTINSYGRALLAEGGFKERRKREELHEMEVRATVSAADSARKSARSARWANIISVIAILISVWALIRTY